MSDTTSVQVAVRIRPLVESEISKGCEDILEVFQDVNQIKIKSSDKAFTFNYVFDSKTKQEHFYTKCIKSHIDSLFKGYNVTILAYGQTGSGKTHSMGTTYSGESDSGIIPRAINDIFDYVKDNFGYDFSITVSFMELYQEVLYDLLSGKSRDQCVVEIREDTRGILIPGLTEISVASTRDALNCLTRGSLGRATGSTNMNAHSSRSHAVFTINISMQKKDDSNSNKTAKFHLVDLAGSERSKKTGAIGQTFKEGVNINKGLLALGNVISALGDEKSQNNFISYRDSNLTRLLKDSLGGNSITLMIACVSPADYNIEETLSTLRYADRAKKIKNKPIVNQDPKAAEINRLQKIIQQLRLELVGQGGPIICPAELELLKKEISELKLKNRHLNIKLSSSLGDNALLHERIYIMETANEELCNKVKTLQDQYNTTLCSINDSIEKSDVAAIKNSIALLETIQSNLKDINLEQVRTMKDVKKHETGTFQTHSLDDSNSESEINEKQETHTAQQVVLNNELQEITRQLALKESLAEHIAANALLSVDQELIAECEKKIVTLETEKDELVQQLKNVMTNGASGKIAEQRRKRLQELESQIQDLKKRIVEQDRLIKLKEKDEQKIKVLRNEIGQMKKTKVDLMKKMRQESEHFRTWKVQRERELHKLKDTDRKRQNQIVKMEIMHTRQQNVLKRKVEEAAAINKRLKDALAKRKAVNDLKSQGKVERIAEGIQHELDIYVSTLDAEHTLKFLLDDRSTLQNQLDSLLKMGNVDEAKLLQDDIQLRSVQIQDLQQKIVDSQEEVKAQSRWDHVQTMSEAKHALKTLFELVADIKRTSYASENKVSMLEQSLKTLTKEKNDLSNKIKKVEDALSVNAKEYEEKISVLLKPVEVNCDDERTKKILQIQQQKVETLEKENSRLQEENSKLSERINDVNNLAEKSKPVKRKPKSSSENVENIKTEPFLEDEIDTETDIDEDSKDDPDWRKTPLAKKMQKLRTFMQPADRLKRSSDGGCACKGNCSTRNCGCKKTSRTCSSSCKCSGDHCVNRNDKTSPENDSGSEDLLKNSKPAVLAELNVMSKKRPRKVRPLYMDDE